MSKPSGLTVRFKIEAYLRLNPGLHRTKWLAIEMEVSQSYVSAVLSELKLNYPRAIRRTGNGRNTRWYVSF